MKGDAVAVCRSVATFLILPIAPRQASGTLHSLQRRENRQNAVMLDDSAAAQGWTLDFCRRWEHNIDVLIASTREDAAAQMETMHVTARSRGYGESV